VAPFEWVERIERRAPTGPRSTSALAARLPRAHSRRYAPGALRRARLGADRSAAPSARACACVGRGLARECLLAGRLWGWERRFRRGLILSELRALGAADRVLIITPAGLRDQVGPRIVSSDSTPRRPSSTSAHCVDRSRRFPLD